MKGYANPHLVVSPQELAPILDGAGGTAPLLLDLRPPEAYAAGHIPGAIHIDLWGVSLIDTDPAPLKAFMWMIDRFTPMSHWRAMYARRQAMKPPCR